MNLFKVAKEIANRLTESFCGMNRAGDRFTGGTEKFQANPH